VTEEYVDLEFAPAGPTGKEAQLTKLIPGEDTEAVWPSTSSCRATQVEIEPGQGRMSYLENLSAMATIRSTCNPRCLRPPVIEEGWRRGAPCAVRQGRWSTPLKGLGDLVIWVIVFLLADPAAHRPADRGRLLPVPDVAPAQAFKRIIILRHDQLLDVRCSAWKRNIVRLSLLCGGLAIRGRRW